MRRPHKTDLHQRIAAPLFRWKSKELPEHRERRALVLIVGGSHAIDPTLDLNLPGCTDRMSFTTQSTRSIPMALFGTLSDPLDLATSLLQVPRLDSPPMHHQIAPELTRHLLARAALNCHLLR